MQLKIFKMTLSDLNSISDTLIQDFDDFWNISILESELKNKNSMYFVAKTSLNEIVGFAGIWLGFEEAHITNIVTKKDKRNCGIGSLLLQYIIDICNNKKEIYSITLEVNENNTPALHLYEKYNFEKVGIRKNYYNQIANAIIMTRKL